MKAAGVTEDEIVAEFDALRRADFTELNLTPAVAPRDKTLVLDTNILVRVERG